MTPGDGYEHVPHGVTLSHSQGLSTELITDKRTQNLQGIAKKFIVIPLSTCHLVYKNHCRLKSEVDLVNRYILELQQTRDCYIRGKSTNLQLSQLLRTGKCSKKYNVLQVELKFYNVINHF